MSLLSMLEAANKHKPWKAPARDTKRRVHYAERKELEKQEPVGRVTAECPYLGATNKYEVQFEDSVKLGTAVFARPLPAAPTHKEE